MTGVLNSLVYRNISRSRIWGEIKKIRSGIVSPEDFLSP